MSDNEDILFAVDRGIATVRLNRPKALNALNFEMTKLLDAKLKAWAIDPAVKALFKIGRAHV
jgi:enoyl-CoA hydratase